MKWTVLSDNRSSNALLSTEHGLSILLEIDRHKILLDTGGNEGNDGRTIATLLLWICFVI